MHVNNTQNRMNSDGSHMRQVSDATRCTLTEYR